MAKDESCILTTSTECDQHDNWFGILKIGKFKTPKEAQHFADVLHAIIHERFISDGVRETKNNVVSLVKK